MPDGFEIIKKGKDLLLPELQPGWKESHDGYGLITVAATYVVDKQTATEFYRGMQFGTAEAGYNGLKLHKWSISHDNLGTMKVVGDYIGIDGSINEGEHTNCQVSASNGLSSEPLTAHPNFYQMASGYMEVIAGSTYAESDLGPTVVKPDGTKGKSYVGQNGACFERETGGRFIGFVDPQYKTLYGKTNYLSPTTQYSGIMYFQKTSAYVAKFKKMIGTSSLSRNWIGQLPDLLPEYFGSNFVASNGYYQLLMTQVNLEDFGDLVKLSYEIRFSRDGWDDKVYLTATSL
jgi:hypothetical protein